MPDTDTCDWPRCRAMAVYTYSAATPTVRLCKRHWDGLCSHPAIGWERLKLKPKREPQSPADIGFAQAAAIVRRHAAGLAFCRRLRGG